MSPTALVEDNLTDPLNRLVWAPLKVKSTELLWPAYVFKDIEEFEATYSDSVDVKDYRNDLILAYYEKNDCRPVRFLSRPLTDLQSLNEDEYCPYKNGGGKPFGRLCGNAEYFVKELSPHLSLPEIQALYQDFHRACHETFEVLKSLKAVKSNSTITRDFVREGERGWEQYMQETGQGTALVTTTNAVATAVAARYPPALPPPRAPTVARALPPNPPVAAAAAGPQSPNHSVAAVSVTEESTATPHPSPMARAARGRPPASTKVPVFQSNWPRPPQELNMIPWKQASTYLCMNGWAMFFHAETEEPVFHLSSNATVQVSAREMKLMAQRYLGWKPPPGEAAEVAPSPAARNQASPYTTPRPTRKNRLCPESNAKDYSFGFTWKHQLEPQGWCRVQPPRGHQLRQVVDYLYLRPHVSVEHLSQYTLGEDYFDDHWKVLDWCRENHCLPVYPGSAGGSANSSVASGSVGTADDPSSYLEDDEGGTDQEESEAEEEDAAPSRSKKQASSKKKKAKTNKKKKKRPSQRNWKFGVLWAAHLQPQGWTMPRAKKNQLIDYYYVRPNRSVEGGREGVDYFTTVEQVLEYCQEHQDYPESSTCATPTDATTDAMSTLASEDESTQHPAETEDEFGHHSDASYSTPGTRTQPQDPGKPLLREESDEEELDEEQKYSWKNLWPMLQNLGWKHTVAKDKLGDWWYVRPRNINKEFSRPKDRPKWIKGDDYFVNPEEVIEYCRRMDRLEEQNSNSHAEDVSDDMEVDQDCDEEDSSGSQSISDSTSSKRLRTKHARMKAKDQRESKPAKRAKQDRQKHKPAKKARESKPETSRQTKSKKKNSPKISSWKSINVDVDPSANTEAPWVKHPVVKGGLHDLITNTMGCHYRNSFYYLPGEDPKQSSLRFTDVSELLAHVCVHYRGRIPISPNADSSDQEMLRRLVNRALVGGFSYDQERTRALNLEEVEVCLKDLLKFQLEKGEWIPPAALLVSGTGSSGESLPPGKLRPSYDSITLLLKDLRCIENFDGSETGRRRKPLIGEAKKEEDHKERVMLAFRLTISEDSAIDKLGTDYEYAITDDQSMSSSKKRASEKSDSSTTSQRKKQRVPKSKPSSSDVGQRRDSLEPSSESVDESSSVTVSSRKPKQLTDSGKKRAREEEVTTMKVKYRGVGPNEAIWALGKTNDLWKIAQKIGVTFSGSVYSVPKEFWPEKHTFPSIDELLTFFGTYGGYSLKNLEGEDKEVFKWRIASCHVPGRSSEWRCYRMLDDEEGILLLQVLGFTNDQSGKWYVPLGLMAWQNEHLDGKPSLLKEEYATVDELRVALRSVPELEVKGDGGPRRRRKQDSTLNLHQLTALRLWLAVGPSGPDEVLHFDPETSPSEEERNGSSSYDGGVENQQIADGMGTVSGENENNGEVTNPGTSCGQSLDSEKVEEADVHSNSINDPSPAEQNAVDEPIPHEPGGAFAAMQASSSTTSQVTEALDQEPSSTVETGIKGQADNQEPGPHDDASVGSSFYDGFDAYFGTPSQCHDLFTQPNP